MSEGQSDPGWVSIGSTEEGSSESLSFELRDEYAVEAQVARTAIVLGLKRDLPELDVYDLLRLAGFVYDGRAE